MGTETNQWRMENFKVGLGGSLERHEGDFYRKRLGQLAAPWWADESYNGLFFGYIPLEVVTELFKWRNESATVWYRVPCDINDDRMSGLDDTGAPYRWVESAQHKVVYGEQYPDVEFGVFGKRSFKHNQFIETLVELPANICDTAHNELGFASALRMRGGAVGVVTIEFPDAIEVPNVGFKHRPSLIIVDAYNGEFKLQGCLTDRVPVCENGAHQYISSSPQRFTLKHTGKHLERIGDMRDALGLMWNATDEFNAQWTALAQWQVSRRDWNDVLDVTVPVPETETDSKGKVLNNRAINNAVRKRDTLAYLYTSDDRAAPWYGTGLGVVQAYNTWFTHERGFKASSKGVGGEGSAVVDEGVDEDTEVVEQQVTGVKTDVTIGRRSGLTTDRLERQWLNTINGTQAKADHGVLATLASVQGVKLNDMLVPA